MYLQAASKYLQSSRGSSRLVVGHEAEGGREGRELLAVVGVRPKLRRDDTDVGRVDRDVHLLRRSIRLKPVSFPLNLGPISPE